MKNYFKIFTAVALSISLLSSCTKDLDRLPQNDVTSETVFATPEGYKQALAKVYGAFAVTGNKGPSGLGDIRGIDEGTSDFLRLYWKAQELSTDEAVVAWNDPGIQDFHNMNWTSSNPMLIGLYNRIFYQITVCNEFMRESTDDKLSSRGISGADAENIRKYRAEARFLRAYQYSIAMDLFANPPFITENDAIGSFLPPQINRSSLFAYVEAELKAVENDLIAARANEYGRADKAAAWALLARLYLNAQVYTGSAKYTEAITYANKVIAAGYQLESNYANLFRADNHKSTNEFILTINYDGLKTKNFGGTTFLTHASVGDNMNPNDFGINGGWFGIRTTRNLPLLFPDFSGNADKRGRFFQNSLEINDLSKFSDGFAVTKFINITSNGVVGVDPDKVFVDIDFPIFRLAEVYLIYAEAVLRGGNGGDNATAIGNINKLRTRAYGNASGNIASMNLDFVLDERARELHWEGFRRTDLIRYGRFTDASYLWPWKGGVKTGRGVPDNLRIFPLPSTDVVANPNLVQNPGY
jgi:starch-binding outer membrane protein, SusD/RagB family